VNASRERIAGGRRVGPAGDGEKDFNDSRCSATCGDSAALGLSKLPRELHLGHSPIAGYSDNLLAGGGEKRIRVAIMLGRELARDWLLRS
jgi:hypothetical protein